MAENTSLSSNSISLNTVDDKIFKVSTVIANQMQIVQSLIESSDSFTVISLPTSTPSTFLRSSNTLMASPPTL
ncbi:hypothetical protein Lal_00039291 [Lupinus albus]|nr:hypothetical protein Lal_00039291 [Lupinus albus]